MTRPAQPTSDDSLDLPPLDGEAEDGEGAAEELPEIADGHDAFDDTTGDDDGAYELHPFGEEPSALVPDEERPIELDVEGLVLSPEESLLHEDEPEGAGADYDFGGEGHASLADGGEEGPLAEDEELREEDLPALDADEDGDVDDATLFDRSQLGEGEELRWDDRAWERAAASLEAADDVEDSGTLAMPGEDAAQGARDATWRRLEESGRLTAATLVPGGSVVVALTAPERSRLVRITTEGVARIIAEIEPRGEDDESCRVLALRWDTATGTLVALGAFGVQAFRPV